MRRSILAAVFTAVALFLGSAPSQAGMLFFAELDGLQEVPPNASLATGFGTFELNDAGTELAFSVSFQDLLAPLTAAHFHNGDFGVNGPVVRGLGAEAPIGSTAGIIAGVWKNTDAQPLTAALVDRLKTEGIYINLHTSNFPGGEIRGQLFLVPEPSAIALTGLGLVGLLAIQRRRRPTRATA